MNQLTVPEWVCTLIGRLVLENEVLRQQVPSPPPSPSNGHVDVEVVEAK
jgi:hypothetical protein